MGVLMGTSLQLALAFTQHFGLDGTYNEIHPSVQFQHDYFIAGAYLNSESNLSLYSGVRFEYSQAWLELGLVSGYAAAPVIPFGRAGFDFNETTSVFIAPAYEPNAGNIGIVVGVEFSSW